MNRQQERETAFLEHQGDSFAIYQVKLDDDSLRDLRYVSMEQLQKQGLQPSRASYELAYTGALPEGYNLNALWEQFNIGHPADYMRPSLSVSDIVAIRKDGVLSCHYVDSFGFQELPNFLQPENYLKSAEMQMEDDLYGLIWFIDETVLPDDREFLARYLRRPERYSELAELVRPYCFRTLRAQAQSYAKVTRRVLFTYEYTPSSQERTLYDLLYAYANQPVKLAFPEMDQYDLALRLLGLQGSSTAAILQTIRGVINRLERMPNTAEELAKRWHRCCTHSG